VAGEGWIWILLLALGAFLLGGVYSFWKLSKAVAGGLLIAALLAIAGGVLWYLP
jgi:hypothetical protein